MLVVGITGGIGSGKSILCKIFAQLKVPVYSSDIEAKNILNTDESVKKRIKEIFGDAIYDSKGNIERKDLSEIVFKDKKKLEALNSIVHPAVLEHFNNWKTLYKEHKYILKEAAVLFESGSYKKLDFIITVTAPVELRIKRVMARDNISRETVEQRMKNQMSDEEKIKLSNYVIVNDEQELVIPQVLKIHNELMEK